MKRTEGVFSPKAQKRYVHKVSCIVKNRITNSLYITFKTTKILHTLFSKYYINIPNVFTIISYSYFRTASTALFSSRVTASSIIASAILVISSSFFASGSANDPKGSGGGDSSAATQNINKFEVTKIKHKVKNN